MHRGTRTRLAAAAAPAGRLGSTKEEEQHRDGSPRVPALDGEHVACHTVFDPAAQNPHIPFELVIQ